MFDFGRIKTFVRSDKRAQSFHAAARALARDEQAATSIEYALIAIIVGVGIVGSLSAITPELVAIFTYLKNQFDIILA